MKAKVFKILTANPSVFLIISLLKSFAGVLTLTDSSELTFKTKVLRNQKFSLYLGLAISM